MNKSRLRFFCTACMLLGSISTQASGNDAELSQFKVKEATLSPSPSFTNVTLKSLEKELAQLRIKLSTVELQRKHLQDQVKKLKAALNNPDPLSPHCRAEIGEEYMIPVEYSNYGGLATINIPEAESLGLMEFGGANISVDCNQSNDNCEINLDIRY